jgi:hypothetical protein
LKCSKKGKGGRGSNTETWNLLIKGRNVYKRNKGEKELSPA